MVEFPRHSNSEVLLTHLHHSHIVLTGLKRHRSTTTHLVKPSKMDTSICSPFAVSPSSNPSRRSRVATEHSKYGVHFMKTHRFNAAKIAAISDVSAVTDPAQAGVTWQIVVGTLAGVTPFVVAGIEFSKRIVAQKRCGVCGGSGLVLRDNKYYFRCPSCGGFLPWQSWKRFFSG